MLIAFNFVAGGKNGAFASRRLCASMSPDATSMVGLFRSAKYQYMSISAVFFFKHEQHRVAKLTANPVAVCVAVFQILKRMRICLV